MDNTEWVKEILEEMFNDLKIGINDDINDRLQKCADDIDEGYKEGYMCSSNYVADQNFQEFKQSEKSNEVEELKNEVELLERFIHSKGFNFKIQCNEIYETGVEYIGGSLSASFERKI